MKPEETVAVPKRVEKTVTEEASMMLPEISESIDESITSVSKASTVSSKTVIKSQKVTTPKPPRTSRYNIKLAISNIR